MAKRVLAVGLEYTGQPIDGVEIETLGLCRSTIAPASAAFSLYDYDTIIINPQTYSQFMFGKAEPEAAETYELTALKKRNESYDLDTAFDWMDRSKELDAAIEDGATVVWCMSPPRRQNFYGYRTTHTGYLSSSLEKAVERSHLIEKKGRKLNIVDADAPFARYFAVLKRDGWSMCLGDPVEGIKFIATTPEGYGLGARYAAGDTNGWLVTPPTTSDAANQLIVDAVAIGKEDGYKDHYHGIFLSHTGDDKPFVRKLRDDLLARGVPGVWLDEAEIQVGDSLTAKIEEGLHLSRYIGVVLSKKSVKAPWVKKELEIAINREIDGGEVVVLPFLYEECELPAFLKGKLYANFTDPIEYEAALNKVLRRLRIN